jgi:hypothetical protein
MTDRDARSAWIAFFAATGGSALAVPVALAFEPSLVVVALLWFVGATSAAFWVWMDDVSPNEFRFTREGASVLGWLLVFFVPLGGLVIGLVLRARGDVQGLPMAAVSTGLIGVYATLAAVL